MARYFQFSITRDEHGRRICLEVPSAALSFAMPQLFGTGRKWIRLWTWVLLSAAMLDLAKASLWLLVLNWRNELPFRSTPQSDLLLIAACMVIVATPFILSVTGRALLRAWRELFPPTAPDAWILPDVSLFDAAAWQEPDDEPPEPRRCGIPVGPRHPGPLVTHARPETASV